MEGSIAERKARWKRFYQSDRAIPFLFLIRYTDTRDPRPFLWPDKKKARVEWLIREYERQLKNLEWLYDDLVPFVDLITGTEIFAEAFGSPVHREPDQMPYALPYIQHPEEADSIVVPKLTESSLMLQFEIADEVRSRLGSDPLMRLPDIQTPMDITALIWKKEHFFPAMLTHPEAVKTLSSKVMQLQMEFLDEWFERYGREFIAHYPEYYMPYGITVSEDEIGAVSARHFDEFFLPELNRLSDRYGQIGIHCCAHARHQWEGLKKVRNLKVLNLNQPTALLKEGCDYFGDGPAFLPVPNAATEAKLHPATAPRGARLIYMYNTSDRDEAKRFSDELREVRDKG